MMGSMPSKNDELSWFGGERFPFRRGQRQETGHGYRERDLNSGLAEEEAILKSRPAGLMSE